MTACIILFPARLRAYPVYVFGLRLLQDDEAMGRLLADDPFDALQLRIYHQRPARCSQDDRPIVYAKRISRQPLLCPFCLQWGDGCSERSLICLWHPDASSHKQVWTISSS